MLSLRNNLFFPQIVKVSDVYLVKYMSPDGDNSLCNEGKEKSEFVKRKKVSAYKLDWNQFDSRLGKEIPGLPDQYEKIVKETKFVISHEYLKEIHRMSQAALSEWNIEKRGFDTVVREHCLQPVFSFIENAFYLLADCVYDGDVQYYSWGLSSKLIKYMMLWKFWTYQIGRGCIKQHAQISELEESIKSFGTLKVLVDPTEHQEYVENAQKLIRDLNEHLELINRSNEDEDKSKMVIKDSNFKTHINC